MRTKDADGILGILILFIVGLSTALGVSIPAVYHFLMPWGLIIIIAVIAALYFLRGHLTTVGQVGILLVGFGLLFVPGVELLESWGYGGKEAVWTSLIGLDNLVAVNPDPEVVRPFIFEKSFRMAYVFTGAAFLVVGFYLIFLNLEDNTW